MKASPTNGLAYKKKFDDIFPKLAEEYDLNLIPFLLKEMALNPKFNQSDLEFIQIMKVPTGDFRNNKRKYN